MTPVIVPKRSWQATPMMVVLGMYLKGTAEPTLQGWGLREVPGIRVPVYGGSTVVVFEKLPDPGTGSGWFMVTILDSGGRVVTADICGQMAEVFGVAERLLTGIGAEAGDPNG